MDGAIHRAADPELLAEFLRAHPEIERVRFVLRSEKAFEEPCSKLQGMFCLTAVLRSDVRKFAIFRLKPGHGFPVRKKYVFI